MVKELEFIYLLNEEGKEEKMRVITFFKIEDTNQEYVVVTPADLDVEEAYVLKFVKESYMTIDNDEEFNLVAETYELLMQEDLDE